MEYSADRAILDRDFEKINEWNGYSRQGITIDNELFEYEYVFGDDFIIPVFFWGGGEIFF
jgi:hypothetical protein